MNRGEFCHQWWQELSRILSSYSPSLSYMEKTLAELYELFGRLQVVVFTNRYEDRGLLLDKIQALCEQGKYKRCLRSIHTAETKFPSDKVWLEFYRFLCQYRGGNKAVAYRALDRILNSKPQLVSNRGFIANVMTDSAIREVVGRHYTEAEIRELDSVIRHEAAAQADFIAQATKLKEYYRDKEKSQLAKGIG